MSNKTKSQLEQELKEAQAEISRLERVLKEGISAESSQMERKLRQVLEILPVGVSILDEQQNVVFQNSALSQIVDINAEGIKAGIYKNRKYLSGDGSPMPPDGFASMQATSTGRAIHNVETGTIHENGETIWSSVSAVPVDFPDWKTVVVTADLTERKLLEKKLRESEQRYTLLFQKSSIPVFLIKLPEVIIADTNEAAEKLAGYTREEMIGRNAAELGLISHAKRKETIEKFENERGLAQNEMRIVTKSGEERVIIVNTNPLEIGGQPYAITSMQDITELKQEAERRQKSELLFRTLFELSPDAVILIDPHDPNISSAIVDCNTTACLMNGYHRDELIGQSIEILNAAPFSEEGRSAYLERLRKEGPLKFEVLHRRKDGTIFLVETSTTLIQVNGRELLIGMDRDITERKRAEEALQESQRNFQLFVEYSPAAIAMFDRDMRYIAASMRFIADYHLPTTDVIGQSHYEIFPEIPERWKAIHRRCLAGAVETAEADPFPRADGRLDWVRWEIHPWYGSDGKVGGIILFSEVITNRMELEQERAKLTERLDLASRSAHMGIWDWDIQKNEILWDDQMYALYGLQPREFGGAYEAWLHGVHPEDREPSNAVSAAAVRGEREYDTEFRVLWPDGSIHWLKANGQVFRDENGVPLRMVGVNYDITERKQAEETLRVSEERLRLSLKAANQGLYDLNVQTGEAIVNDEYALMLGYDPSDFHETNSFWIERLHPDDRAATAQAYKDYVEGKLPEYRVEFRQRTRAGGWIWILSLGKLVQWDEHGQPLRMLGTHTNIHTRRLMEDELRRSNAELEQFAYVASHDLQEPLRAVAGMVQLLQKRYQGQLDERADEYIAHAVEAAGRMQALIQALLTYSRVERRNQPIEAVGTGNCLQAALKNLDVSIRESHAVITTGDLPLVHADPVQLIQLFQNLIGNGIKFRGERDPQIHISATKLKDAWQFSVQDNGIGIESQYYERIFQIFQRLHTRREYSGTGIGLALCKKIIERHGGSIWVESEPGRGSTFHFTLPLRSQP